MIPALIDHAHETGQRAGGRRNAATSKRVASAAKPIPTQYNSIVGLGSPRPSSVPDLSGEMELEKNYRVGDRFRLDGVPVRVTLRADDAGDQIDRVVLSCVVEEPPAS